MFEHSAIVVISKKGKASKVLKLFKDNGISGGTIVYGDGTANNEFLKLLDYDHIQKEILFSVVERSKEVEMLNLLNDKFQLHKPNHGIAFTIPLTEVVTNKNRSPRDNKEERNKMSHEVIFVVVDNHRGDDVVEIANSFGAKGATILHGRGSGAHEKGSIFNITIEPEKEIVMMLVPEEKHAEIIDGLSKALNIDEPGNGIIFSAGVNNALGLVE